METIALSIRAPSSLADWIKEQAKTNHRSLSGEIIIMLERDKAAQTLEARS